MHVYAILHERYSADMWIISIKSQFLKKYKNPHVFGLK